MGGYLQRLAIASRLLLHNVGVVGIAPSILLFQAGAEMGTDRGIRIALTPVQAQQVLSGVIKISASGVLRSPGLHPGPGEERGNADICTTAVYEFDERRLLLEFQAPANGGIRVSCDGQLH